MIMNILDKEKLTKLIESIKSTGDQLEFSNEEDVASIHFIRSTQTFIFLLNGINIISYKRSSKFSNSAFEIIKTLELISEDEFLFIDDKIVKEGDSLIYDSGSGYLICEFIEKVNIAESSVNVKSGKFKGSMIVYNTELLFNTKQNLNKIKKEYGNV